MAASQQAVEKLMSDDRRAAQVARAVGKVQRGKAALDAGQERMLQQLNLATRGDYKALGKRLAVLKRRVKALSDKLDKL